MANHDAANLIYPLSRILIKKKVDPLLRREIYKALLEDIERYADYGDHPELFDLDDALQEAVFEVCGDRWAEYYTIDTSKLKSRR